jgi:hypothetical protein
VKSAQRVYDQIFRFQISDFYLTKKEKKKGAKYVQEPEGYSAHVWGVEKVHNNNI